MRAMIIIAASIVCVSVVPTTSALYVNLFHNMPCHCIMNYVHSN